MREYLFKVGDDVNVQWLRGVCRVLWVYQDGRMFEYVVIRLSDGCIFNTEEKYLSSATVEGITDTATEMIDGNLVYASEPCTMAQNSACTRCSHQRNGGPSHSNVCAACRWGEEKQAHS